MNIPYICDYLNTAKLDRYASSLRKRAALEISRQSIIEPVENEKASHFSLYLDSLPLPGKEKDIHFNNLVTDFALDEYVLTRSDPYEVLYLASKVVEQTFYIIFNASDPSNPLKNLSVAKHYGVFFTPSSIASKMVENLTNGVPRKTLLDPCAGAGVLLGEAIIRWSEFPYDSYKGVELDDQLSTWANAILKRIAGLVHFEGHVGVEAGDGLVALMNCRLSKDSNRADIIINPPFGRMRVTSDRATNKETKFGQGGSKNIGTVQPIAVERIAERSKIFTRFPELKIDSGIPELSKLFLHACVLNANAGSQVSFIGPDTWMSGRQTAAIRAKIIEDRVVHRVLFVKESLQSFSTVNQHTSIVFMSGLQSSELTIATLDQAGSMTKIPYSDLDRNAASFVGIPRLSGAALKAYAKLDKMPKFGRQPWLVNARGEVDQTLQKELFLNSETNTRLVRGVHIGQFNFSHTSSEGKPSFLDEKLHQEFIDGKPKASCFLTERIVGRQCSYAQQEKRLIFCKIPEKCAVGNSCNFITVKKESELIFNRLNLVLGLLNSSVLDWFFSVSNGNNHVANYEIDNFPFPSNESYFGLIASLVEKIENTDAQKNPGLYTRHRQLLDALCALSFDLDPEAEIPFVLDAKDPSYVMRVQNLARHILRGVQVEISRQDEHQFNHRPPTLSALDMMVIESVPEGGNWQDIPLTVPGERLAQIRKMTAERGVVRTTYYGRLRRDHPAYTINTYFNRPGNGTHIHPIENRTLSSREAARLQSFPDDYIFTGSQASVRNQIGNAVPPLLAKAVGRRLSELVPGRLCIDMFCGAGGMSLGLEAAGWHALCGIDNDTNALNTYALNRASVFEADQFSSEYTSVLKRDLLENGQLENIYEKIEQGLAGQQLDLLVGGPPCQGFSHAGFRNPADRRNDLASIFIECAERLRPSLFLLENVEGLATLKKGAVIADIIRTLQEIGYTVAKPVWKLHSEEFGVPQMRRRLFIVASLDSMVNLQPPPPSHKKCRGRREAKNETASWIDESLLPYRTVEDALDGLSLEKAERPQNELDQWLK